ncbi:MAG: hypothetical protein GYA55_10165 [SAR324 cluster bacterium]|uniref:Uncharacterized protein n=1 Tax=SAR324 cluster bacterium TaxID=2024889 RepID=A0A7X9FSH7_9DELT|nr:hypothetical protein [SAR324 cluster bacterium]
MTAFRELLKTEILGATVSALHLSTASCFLRIPSWLMNEAELFENEKVRIWHPASARAFDAYVQSNPNDGNDVSISGILTQYVKQGDQIHITSFIHVSEVEAQQYEAKRIHLNAENEMSEESLEVRGPLFYSTQKTV